MDVRSRLGILASRAGYTTASLGLIAQATLPQFAPGQTLGDAQVSAVCSAVEVLARSGLTDGQIGAVIADYHAQFGAQWRERFWETRLMLGALRAREHPTYGPSPCDVPEPLPAGARPAVAQSAVVVPAAPAAAGPLGAVPGFPPQPLRVAA